MDYEGRSDTATGVRSTRAPALPTNHEGLGPCSLAPRFSFWSACASVFETARRLTTSATAQRRVDNVPGLSFLAGDGGRDLLPVSDASRRLSRESGGARRAAHSSVRADPGAGSSRLRGFARPRYRPERVAPSSSRPRKVRRSTCTGLRTKRRTRPRGERVRSFCGCVRLAHADGVPLLGEPKDTRGRRRDRPQGKRPAATDTDRPRSYVLTGAAKRVVVPKTWVPFTVTNARPRGGWLLVCGLVVGLPLTPPRRALQASQRGRARAGHSGVRAPCSPAGQLAPGTDDPKHASVARTGEVGREAGCLARSAPAAAP